MIHRLALLLAISLALAGGTGGEPAATDADHAMDADQGTGRPGAQKVAAAHLPNAYRVHEKVISGGQPEGEAGFRELRELGIQTIISVDGAKPDVAMARRYGMRYVHLPHGYDGVHAQRVRELAKAVRDLPGPIYLHCHHGKHRSPAAATVACVAIGLLQPDEALGVLRTAGTSQDYRGLYESAESARRLDDAVLDALEADFPEIARLPLMAETMVAIGQTHDRLQAIAQSEWRTPQDDPDADPAHEALMLREHFTELLRSEDVTDQPQQFQELLRESESASQKLESVLRNEPDATRTASATLAFARLSNHCTTCHRTFRDVPLSEKQAAGTR